MIEAPALLGLKQAQPEVPETYGELLSDDYMGDSSRSYQASVLENLLEEIVTANTSYRNSDGRIFAHLVQSPSSSGSSIIAGALSEHQYVVWSDYKSWLVAQRANWVDRALQLYNEGNEEGALREIALSMLKSKESGDVEEIARGVVTADFEKLPDILLVGILRTAFSIRHNIPDWSQSLERASRVLGERGRNPKVVLRGLDR